MNTSLSNIWKSWYLFRKGKRKTTELNVFQYGLEKNLFELHKDLNAGMYRHGTYRRFVVFENKKREIVVASIRDRVVHRLVYEYLVFIFDQTFLYDVWSCRKGKGLTGAIDRAQEMMLKNKNGFVWRADIKKFFDTVDQEVLLQIISRKVSDPKALSIVDGIIHSYYKDEIRGGTRERERGKCHRNEEERRTNRESHQPDFLEYIFERVRPICCS
jgi:retron-type reverse transcriptase